MLRKAPGTHTATQTTLTTHTHPNTPAHTVNLMVLLPTQALHDMPPSRHSPITHSNSLFVNCAVEHTGFTAHTLCVHTSPNTYLLACPCALRHCHTHINTQASCTSFEPYNLTSPPFSLKNCCAHRPSEHTQTPFPFLSLSLTCLHTLYVHTIWDTLPQIHSSQVPPHPTNPPPTHATCVHQYTLLPHPSPLRSHRHGDGRKPSTCSHRPPLY